MMMMMMMAD